MRLTKILILVLALALCLAGCKSRTEELALVITEADFAQLEEYPNLKKLDLTGSTCYDAIEDYIASHPEVEVTYTVALAGKEYDLVLVNIVADVIIGLSPVLPNFLTEKSTLICSGILDSRLEDVLTALKNAGLTVTSVREKEDWRCVTAKK